VVKFSLHASIIQLSFLLVIHYEWRILL